MLPSGGLNFGVAQMVAGKYLLSFVARALEATGEGNVLSTPNLLTLDNEEAKIVIGQNVPFVTGQFTNTGATNGSVNPFQTIERKDVGLTLRVKPQISENGTVKLQIFQEVSSVDPTSRSDPAGLITNKRSIESNILVDDGQIVVLGGLLQDDYSDEPAEGAGAGRRAAVRQPVQEPDAQPQEDQPDGVPAAGGDPRHRAERCALAGPLRPDARQGNRCPARPQRHAARGRRAGHARPACARGDAGRGARTRDDAVRGAGADEPVEPAVRYPLPYAFARGNQLLLEDDGNQLVLWHGAAPAGRALGEVVRKYGVRSLQVLDPEALAQRISAAYAQGESSAATVVSEVQNDADLSRMMQELPAVEDLLETSDDAPIIRMLNALLTQAARDGASDIHIEPYERHSSVRFRVDGTLREVVQPNRALHAALISRLKIMAELDIAEKRLPQDGRI